MSILAESSWLLLVLLVLLGAGVWIAPVLLITGYVGMALFTQAPSGPIMATTIWSASSNWALTSLPLFIWMGEILFRSRISQDMFRGLAPWVGRLPGGLVHTNVLGCGIFAAISGSSAATAATIGRMTVPELTKRGYEPAMVAGSLAGAGTLGLLIPPSIIMIVYGVAADVSIARLFVAGVLPGLLLMALFSGFIAIWALARPELQPPREAAVSLEDKLAAGKYLLPTVVLIAAVVGSIYTGVATPTESAALGVLGALMLSAWSSSLSRAVFVEGVTGAVKTSCMITFILMGASFLTASMGFTGIPRALAEWIAQQGLAPWQLIAMLTALFMVLGCFIDGISMVVLTAAVILPSVKAAGIDLLWFGIFTVLVVEMAQITPPVGFNLYVLQNLTGKDMFYIARASLPFFLLMATAVVLIWVFPQIVTVLPAQMFNLAK
ncbi:MAG: TRAP transporter large permease subunit [Burkholderiales bacterium]|nr:TRAP transporter large permease subunit [Burkholderiales bacterium]